MAAAGESRFTEMGRAKRSGPAGARRKQRRSSGPQRRVRPGSLSSDSSPSQRMCACTCRRAHMSDSGLCDKSLLSGRLCKRCAAAATAQRHSSSSAVRHSPQRNATQRPEGDSFHFLSAQRAAGAFRKASTRLRWRGDCEGDCVPAVNATPG